jgi:HEPN domain-containing protein
VAGEGGSGLSNCAAAYAGCRTDSRGNCVSLPASRENYLKAFLVRHQVEFPKTHHLEQLLDLTAPIAPELAASLEETEVLSPYAVDIRYPGDFPELLPGQENTVFELASRAREAVIAQLSPFLSGG